MRGTMIALVTVLMASAASGQTTIEQRNTWRRQAAQFEKAAEGLRTAAECDMPAFPVGWQERMEVYPVAAPGSPLVNIPVAVTIQSPHLANAKEDGSDVLFTSPADGTTPYPSWRAGFTKAGTPTWKGFVLFPTYAAGDHCFVNYANPAASDQSTTAALTGGGMIGYCNFQSTDTSQLVDVISGNTATVTGGSGASVVAGPYWSAWQFSINSKAVFGAGVLQPSQPHTRVFRTARQQVGATLFSYGSSVPGCVDIGTANWLYTPGGTGGQLLFLTKPVSGTWATLASSQASGTSTVYINGAASGSVAASDSYAGGLTLGNTTVIATHAEYAYFSGTRDANWHAFWPANTGSVTLSDPESAPSSGSPPQSAFLLPFTTPFVR